MEVIFFISYLTILGDFAVGHGCRERQAGCLPPSKPQPPLWVEAYSELPPSNN